MTITEIKENKKRYLELLLLADEQEDMVDRYLETGKRKELINELERKLYE